MIPLFDERGLLPAGVHDANWQEFTSRFGISAYRMTLMSGLRRGSLLLHKAGCKEIYVDGSFVTAKPVPGDFDACWRTDGVNFSSLDPVFFDFSNGRFAQKLRFGGEFFPATFTDGKSATAFLDFFQHDKDSGTPKGIVALDLERLV